MTSMSESPAAEGGRPRLPPEVLCKIIDLSASSEPAPSPHHLSLALTSRAVHAWSERGRWRSLVLRTHAQVLNFADLLHVEESTLRHQAKSFGITKAHDGWRWKGPIHERVWTPEPKKLCSYIANFLIEMEHPGRELARDAASSHLGQKSRLLFAFETLQEIFVGMLHRVTHWSTNLEVMSLCSVVLSGLEGIKRDKKRRDRAKRGLFINGFYGVVPMPPTYPHPGAMNMYELEPCPLFGPYGPRELTLEWDGNEWTLHAILYSDTWCPIPDIPPTYLQTSPNLDIGPGPVYVGLACRLRKLHIIGYDPENPHDGFALPVQALMNSVIAGSLRATHNLAQVRETATRIWRDKVKNKASMESWVAANPGQPLSVEAYQNRTIPMGVGLEVLSLRHLASPLLPVSIPMVTHLRFDTPKFTMRPFEALAQRLQPFFEHLHVVGAAYPPKVPTNAPDKHQHRRRARHPYHDASVQASLREGSYAIPLDSVNGTTSGNDATASIEAAEYHLRAAFGAGAFARLHLAWDAPSAPSDEAAISSRMQSLSTQSDWPAERRDVWTNHSSPAASSSRGGGTAGKKGSATGSSKTGPSNASSAFTMELAEAIEHRIQYPFTQQLFEARARGTYPSKPLIQHRDPEEVQVLNSLDVLWGSDTERSAKHLSRVLADELILRGCTPTQLAARAKSRSTSSSSAAAASAGPQPGALQDYTLKPDGKLDPPLPEGTVNMHQLLAVAAFQPELELVPISPYAPSPAGLVAEGSLRSGGAGGGAFRRKGPSTASRPDPILKLGEVYAAFTPEERVRLFTERIQGKAGAWI